MHLLLAEKPEQGVFVGFWSGTSKVYLEGFVSNPTDRNETRVGAGGCEFQGFLGEGVYG